MKYQILFTAFTSLGVWLNLNLNLKRYKEENKTN